MQNYNETGKKIKEHNHKPVIQDEQIEQEILIKSLEKRVQCLEDQINNINKFLVKNFDYVKIHTLPKPTPQFNFENHSC